MTVTAEVASSDTTAPNITGFRDTPGTVNQDQNVKIYANVSDRSPLTNVSVTVHHPDTGSNATEPPAAMTRTGNGRYRYTFNNTNETGHYTFDLDAWDLSGNTDSATSTSFNVTGNYTVIPASGHGQYHKGEDADLNITVKDVNGNIVDDVNVTLTLDRDGSNTTLLPYNTTKEASYRIKSSDSPGASADPSSLPRKYTIHANVSDGQNTGRNTSQFNVTRLFVRDESVLFATPQQGDNIDPGATFTVELDINYRRSGTPVTDAVAWVRCNTCPSDFKILTHNGGGNYSATFTAPSDDDSALLRAFADDGLGNRESQADQAAPAISVDITTEDGGSGGGGGGQT
ncbi:MAG: hypothetical protein ABEI97_01365, partial [Candidatus Nanohaloarchaea archaeon]